jgi:hypothetical protein
MQQLKVSTDIRKEVTEKKKRKIISGEVVSRIGLA